MIRVERQEEGQERALQRERHQQAERLIQLPARVDIEESEATCENGVCQVTLPKREEEQRKQIAFQ